MRSRSIRHGRKKPSFGCVATSLAGSGTRLGWLDHPDRKAVPDIAVLEQRRRLTGDRCCLEEWAAAAGLKTGWTRAKLRARQMQGMLWKTFPSSCSCCCCCCYCCCCSCCCCCCLLLLLLPAGPADEAERAGGDCGPTSERLDARCSRRAVSDIAWLEQRRRLAREWCWREGEEAAAAGLRTSRTRARLREEDWG